MKARRITIMAGAVFGIAAMGGRAYAVFTSTATGDGQAQIVTTLAARVTTDATEDPKNQLTPGSTAVLTATVQNPNDRPVLLEDVSIGTVTSSAELDCPGSTVSVRVDPLDPAPFSADSPVHVTLRVLMSPDAPNGCQTQSFTIPLTVKVRLSA